MQSNHLAARVCAIKPFRVMEILERAKVLEAQGREIIHFEVGEPDQTTAEPIVEAARSALARGATQYTQALGMPELRGCISAYYAELGVQIPSERIVVTSGASGGLALLAALLLDPGDEVLLGDPGYPCNEVFVSLVNGVPVRVPLTADSGYCPTLQDIDRHWSERSKILLLASPANPTGAVISRTQLKALTEHVRKLGGITVLDEIYQGLVYDDSLDYHTGLQVDSELIVINSFSKYFGMTGWRLGWVVVPEVACEAIAKLAQNLFICASTPAQHAALAAFEPEAMAIHESRRQAFAQRRDRLYSGLLALGFTISKPPAGAFYLYVDIRHTGLEASEFCHRLLEDYGVAVTPGEDFGDYEAQHHVRFAYTTNQVSIATGLSRLAEALSSWALPGERA